MPYEDDYKKWLEEMLIESNPDWVCDGMYDMEFTYEWCGKHCGEDSNYVTPKCLHLYYHHIAKEDRKTENCSEKPNNYCDDCLYTDTCDSKKFFYACTSKATISKMEQVEDEPQTGRFWCATCKYNEWDNMNPKCDECIVGEDKPSNYEPQTDCPWK